MTDFFLPLAIGLTFFLAGIVKGGTGMGLPTVAMGILGALISPLAAATLLIVPSFVTNIWQIAAGPAVLPLLRRLWPMMLATGVTTMLAASFLVGGDNRTTTAALGTALTVYAAYTLFGRQLTVPEAWEPRLSPAIGAITGIITGCTGVFVIPAVPYLQALGLPRDHLVQALGLSFTVSTIALAAGLGVQGAIAGDTLLASTLAVVPALAGMHVGQALRHRISPDRFRRLFLGCLLLLGLEMIIRAAF